VFSSRRQRQRILLAALAIVGIALGLFAYDVHLLDSNLQASVYDTFITNAPGKLSNQVTIVALDDATVTRYGKYPVPRQAWVDLLAALRPLGPRVVAFDVGFYDESPNPDQDRALALAIKESGNVILAMQGRGAHRDGDGTVHYNNEQVPITILRQAAAGLASVNIDQDDDGRARPGGGW
jgi:CHASE2 domain-containing sensor protein